LQILVNEYTEFQDQSPKKTKHLTKDDLIDNQSYIIALGDVDDKDILTAKRIIRITPPKFNKKTVWGQIQSVNNSNIIIQTKDNKKVTLETSDDTFFDLNNQDASIKDVKQNKYLVAVGTGTDRLDASYIHLIATTGYFKPQSSPTPSPTASPSAKPKK
jgi:hypothetical protein